jgi:hypothetical protein
MSPRKAAARSRTNLPRRWPPSIPRRPGRSGMGAPPCPRRSFVVGAPSAVNHQPEFAGLCGQLDLRGKHRPSGRSRRERLSIAHTAALEDRIAARLLADAAGHAPGRMRFLAVQEVERPSLMWDDRWVISTFDWLGYRCDAGMLRVDEGVLVTVPAEVDRAHAGLLDGSLRSMCDLAMSLEMNNGREGQQ